MAQTMPHWLTKQTALSPQKTAFELTDGTTVTFTELKRQSESAARKLAHLGIQKNDRVAILSNNSLEMVFHIFALSYLEAVAVMLNTRLTSTELSYQLKTAKTKLLLTTETVQDEKRLTFSNRTTFHELSALPEKQINLSDEINLSDPFTMMFTSGTTGKPKAVVHTYGNHWWSAIGSALNLGLDQHDKWLLTLPIFHIGGFSILMKSVIYGMEVYLMEKYEPQTLYHALADKRITIASVVTIMLRDILERMGKKQLPTHVRCLLLGGGSVPPLLLDQVKEKNLPLFQSYGLTETSSQIVTLGAEDIHSKMGSAGKPLFPAALDILNPNETGVGEIIVKGPMVMHGYDDQQQANEDSFAGSWFKTGDLGYIDTDGFLFVVDRRTDLIISGGENIYPTEVEDVFLEVSDVLEAAVVGKEDETWGQVPVAWVVRANEHVTESKLIDHAKTKLAGYKVPKTIYFTERLPRNASNKIMRHRLKRSSAKK